MVEYFMSKDGIMVPFKRKQNELYPNFLLRVRLTLEALSEANYSDHWNQTEISKKIAREIYGVKYQSSFT